MKVIVIDSDYTFNKMNQPVIRLFGKVLSENTEKFLNDIVLHVRGFEPYIYLNFVVDDLIDLLKKEFKGYIKRVEKVKRYKPIGYQTEKSDMLKIILFNPKVVHDLRKMLVERIEEITSSDIYEADIPFKDRFLVDNNITGMSVIEFRGNKLKNYGMNCDNLYICNSDNIRVLDENIKIEY